jgi:hypothetical protein
MKSAFIAITFNKSTNEYILDINSKTLPKTIIEFDTNKINLLIKAKNWIEQNKEKFESESFFEGIFLSSSLVNRITYDEWDFICGKEPTGDGPMPTAIRQSM